MIGLKTTTILVGATAFLVGLGITSCLFTDDPPHTVVVQQPGDTVVVHDHPASPPPDVNIKINNPPPAPAPPAAPPAAPPDGG